MDYYKGCMSYISDSWSKKDLVQKHKDLNAKIARFEEDSKRIRGLKFKNDLLIEEQRLIFQLTGEKKVKDELKVLFKKSKAFQNQIKAKQSAQSKLESELRNSENQVEEFESNKLINDTEQSTNRISKKSVKIGNKVVTTMEEGGLLDDAISDNRATISDKLKAREEVYIANDDEDEVEEDMTEEELKEFKELIAAPSTESIVEDAKVDNKARLRAKSTVAAGAYQLRAPRPSERMAISDGI
jgi:hypothetical protein